MNEEHIQEHNEKEHEIGVFVGITVDNEVVNIHRGRQSAAEIKNAAEIPLAYELAQVIEKRLISLPDDGFVTIKGGEQFISYPKTGAAS